MSEMNEHLEHAEHAEHASHDPFTIRVAMTMAIVAATLAAVTLVSHRAHNNTLLYQTEHGNLKVQESNAWSQYQAKRLRQHIEENSTNLIVLLGASAEADIPRDLSTEEQKKTIAAREKELIGMGGKKKREGESKESTGEKKEVDAAKLSLRQSVLLHLKEEVSRYKEELKEVKEKAEEIQKQAEEAAHKASHIHHQADWFDIAHLMTEMGLVLCSIAILTRQKFFWLAGILVSIGGIGLVAWGFLMVH